MGVPSGDAMTRGYPGSGLGLSIVKELCKLLGGEVSVASELGKGSTFTVRIPWTLSEPVRADAAIGEDFDSLDLFAFSRTQATPIRISLLRPHPTMPDLPADETPEVQLFADGACSGNPGPGGWAFILRHPATGKELEASGAERETTNNRMEMTAVIRGLESLKRGTRVEVITDSIYVGKGLSEWMPKWKLNGWRRREGGQLKPIKNEELWRRMDELLAKHQVRFTHVRGHQGHTENERCDTLAVAAYQKYR